jgi:small subunit ribosomal protein S1
MSWTKKIKNPRSILEIGQEVEVVVSAVDAEKRRLSLSLRATEANPWEQVAESYSVGSRVKGVVRNLTDFGAFVEIVPGVDGLVHISDMAWTRRINHPSEVVQKGESVEAVITSVDAYTQRISLSMKELLPNEWEEYANSHGVGDVVGGTVTNVTDFGVFIELAPGVEGLCHISEIDREEGLGLAEMFSTGSTTRCRILRIDWHESRIGLTMHGIDQESDADESVAEADEPAGADTAMAAALRAQGLIAEPDESESAAVEEEEPAVEAEASSDDEAAGDGEGPTADAESEVETATDESAPIEAEPASDDDVAEEIEAAAEEVVSPEPEDPAAEEEADQEMEATADADQEPVEEPEVEESVGPQEETGSEEEDVASEVEEETEKS